MQDFAFHIMYELYDGKVTCPEVEDKPREIAVDIGRWAYFNVKLHFIFLI